MWAQHATFLETISREREIVCVCAKIKPTKVRTTTVGGQESAAKWQQKNELITLQSIRKVDLPAVMKSALSRHEFFSGFHVGW